MSITLPFGSKSAESFAEAENFFVASTPNHPLLNASITCDQGLNNDEFWTCTPFKASHTVCGHFGVFKFDYPNYQVNEKTKYIRLGVSRSGGGYGDVTVNYYVKHFTTNDSDLISTAPYTTIQKLTFASGKLRFSSCANIPHILY